MGRTVSSPFELRVTAQSPLPSWVPPPGTFAEFTLNRPSDVGMVPPNLANWCGGAFVPDYGPRGAACYHGGGEHSAWNDSGNPSGEGGVWVLDCETRLYSRVCASPAKHVGGVIASGTYVGSDTDDYGAYLDDGSPQSKHTYNCMSYMPRHWGEGLRGSLMRVRHSGGLSKSRLAQGYAATWRFDLSKTAHVAQEPSIFKMTDFYHRSDGATIATVNDASSACIDLVREGWWASCRTGDRDGGRMSFTSKTGQITENISSPWNGGHSGMHHFADDDILVRLTDLGMAPSETPTWHVWVWQAGRGTGWSEARLSRQTIPEVWPSGPKAGLPAYPSVGYMHPRWSSILNCFVGFDFQWPIDKYVARQSTTEARIWKIHAPPPGRRFTGTWTAEYETVVAKPGSAATNVLRNYRGSYPSLGDAGAVNGSWGRFVECPSLQAFVWTRHSTEKGQLFRLRAM